VRPNALEEISLTELVERILVGLLRGSQRHAHALGTARFEEFLLVNDRAEQRGERVGEQLHAFDLELTRHLEERDLGVLQPAHDFGGCREIALHRVGHDLSVIEQGVER